jgi:hypothetical protein
MNKWYDKYFPKKYQKKIFDVYLEYGPIFEGSQTKCNRAVVVLTNGAKGYKGWLGTDYFFIRNLKETLRCALYDAIEEAKRQELPNYESDFNKYLLPTIGTTRPDPRLISEFEKGYTPKCH